MGAPGGALGFDPRRDAETLKAAFKGVGTDEKTVIRVLGSKFQAQRLQIAQAYQQLYGKSLDSALTSETSGNFASLLKRLVRPTHVVKSDYLHDAMAGAGTKDLRLIDVLTQTSNAELAYIRQAFQADHGKNLDSRIREETSGNFKKALERLLEGRREEGPVNDAAASADAVNIYKAGEKKWGTDDSAFIQIFTSRSSYHLQAVDKYYRQNRNKSVLDAIRSETSGDFMEVLLACCKTPEIYFAERLHSAIAGVGTNDEVLVYVIAVTEKPVLQGIARQYATMYGHFLEGAMKGDTSGHYKDLLIELLK